MDEVRRILRLLMDCRGINCFKDLNPGFQQRDNKNVTGNPQKKDHTNKISVKSSDLIKSQLGMLQFLPTESQQNA